MRKLGFTLAEVLITLGIIGVIATLTLPTLMSNTAEREYSTALKKGISALTEAVQMQVALENVSFDEMVDTDVDTEVNSFYAFLCNRMQTERYASSASEACDDNLADSSSGNATTCLGYGGMMESNVAMFFRDGSAIIYDATLPVGGGDEGSITCQDAMGEDVVCFKMVYDTNGFKKPNMLANCMNDKTKSPVTNDTSTECTNKNFVARDQYPIKLYGVGVYPNSPAAHYIFNKK